MKQQYQCNTPQGVVDILKELIQTKRGPITLIDILPPGTPLTEVSLAHTQEVTHTYIIKVDL